MEVDRHAERAERFTRMIIDVFNTIRAGSVLMEGGVPFDVTASSKVVFDKIDAVLDTEEEHNHFLIFCIGLLGDIFVDRAEQGFGVDAYDDDDPRTFVTGVGQTLFSVHPRSACEPPCVIHSPASGPWDHQEGWKTFWDDMSRQFFRYCPHGVPHLAKEEFVDNAAFALMCTLCDGCCAEDAVDGE